MRVCATVDMDDYREYRRLVDPGGPDPSFSFYTDAVPRFLDAFERHGIRATFFVVGMDAEVPAHRRTLREIRERGHELANHSWSHPYDLRSLSRAAKQAEIARAEAAIADAVGERPVGFRCPSGELDAEVLSILDERGYLYDSTIFPTPFMWLFMLYGKLFVRHPGYALGEKTAVFSPRRPFWPTAERIHRERARPTDPGPRVLEIPFSCVPLLGIPFYGTLFRMLPPAVFDAAVRAHGGRGGLVHMLYHLMDLVDLSGAALDGAIRATPGLGVPFARRARFVERSLAVLAARGEAVPLCELARAAHGALCAPDPRRGTGTDG